MYPRTGLAPMHVEDVMQRNVLAGLRKDPPSGGVPVSTSSADPCRPLSAISGPHLLGSQGIPLPAVRYGQSAESFDP